MAECKVTPESLAVACGVSVYDICTSPMQQSTTRSLSDRQPLVSSRVPLSSVLSGFHSPVDKIASDNLLRISRVVTEKSPASSLDLLRLPQPLLSLALNSFDPLVQECASLGEQLLESEVLHLLLKFDPHAPHRIINAFQTVLTSTWMLGAYAARCGVTSLRLRPPVSHQAALDDELRPMADSLLAMIGMAYVCSGCQTESIHAWVEGVVLSWSVEITAYLKRLSGSTQSHRPYSNPCKIGRHQAFNPSPLRDEISEDEDEDDEGIQPMFVDPFVPSPFNGIVPLKLVGHLDSFQTVTPSDSRKRGRSSVTSDNRPKKRKRRVTQSGPARFHTSPSSFRDPSLSDSTNVVQTSRPLSISSPSAIMKADIATGAPPLPSNQDHDQENSLPPAIAHNMPNMHSASSSASASFIPSPTPLIAATPSTIIRPPPQHISPPNDTSLAETLASSSSSALLSTSELPTMNSTLSSSLLPSVLSSKQLDTIPSLSLSPSSSDYPLHLHDALRMSPPRPPRAPRKPRRSGSRGGGSHWSREPNSYRESNPSAVGDKFNASARSGSGWDSSPGAQHSSAAASASANRQSSQSLLRYVLKTRHAWRARKAPDVVGTGMALDLHRRLALLSSPPLPSPSPALTTVEMEMDDEVYPMELDT